MIVRFRAQLSPFSPVNSSESVERSNEESAGQAFDHSLHLEHGQRGEDSRRADLCGANDLVQVLGFGRDHVEDLAFLPAQGEFTRAANFLLILSLDRLDKRAQRLDNVIDVANQSRAVSDQIVAAIAGETVDATGDRHDFPALLHGVSRGVKCSAFSIGFDNDDAQRQSADDAVSLWENSRRRLLIKSRLADDRAVL